MLEQRCCWAFRLLHLLYLLAATHLMHRFVSAGPQAAEGGEAHRGGHVAAVLGLEAKLASKQQETADLQQLNQRLFARFQALRDQLAHSQDKLSHTQLRGQTSGFMHHAIIALWNLLQLWIECNLTPQHCHHDRA